MKDFLKILNKRLYFLNSEERNKIIEEYKDKIEDNYNKCHDIKKSINDLGDIDNIINDICDRYNLSKELSVRENKIDKDVKVISNMLGNFIRDILKVVRKTRLQGNLESFLEVIVKLIYLLFVYGLAKLPCILLENLFDVLNNFLFFPYNKVFNVCTDSLIMLAYFIFCSVITLKAFGSYRIKNKKMVDEKEINSIDKEYNWLDFIIRIVVYLIILIPLGLLTLSLFIVSLLCIYLVTTGINFIGIPILLLGIVGLLLVLFLLVSDALKGKDRSYTILVCTSITLFFFGIAFTMDNYSKFNKTKDITKSSIQMTTDDLNLTLKEEIKRVIVKDGTYELVVDDTLNDNDIKISITYCDDYYDIVYDQVVSDEKNYLYFAPVVDKDIKGDKIFNNVLKDLRNGYIIDYSKLRKVNVVIKGNQETVKRLK